MMRSYEAVIDASGRIQLLESVQLRGLYRAVVTLLKPVSEEDVDEVPLRYAQSPLSHDWEKPEEDEAWAHLQPDR